MADDNFIEKKTDPMPEMDSKSKKIKICRFHAKNGYCKFKENCRFLHSTAKAADITTSLQENNEEVTGLPVESEQKQISENKNNSVTKKKRCRFSNTKGGCARGDSCKYAHQQVVGENEDVGDSSGRSLSKEKEGTSELTTELNQALLATKNRAVDTKPPITSKDNKNVSQKGISSPETAGSKTAPVKKINGDSSFSSTRVLATMEMMSALNDDQLSTLKTREIEQLLRRFGKKKATEIPCSDGTMYSIVFTPSDPDWPFEIESIILEVTFSHQYPKKMFDACLSQDQPLPSDLISLVNQGILKWTQQQQQIRDNKGTVDLPFRPFLRWLDRNIEKLFIDAAKKMKAQEELGNNLMESESSEEDTREHYTAKTLGDIGNNEPDPETNYKVEKIHSIPREDFQYQRKQPQKHNYQHVIPDRIDIQLSDLLTLKNQPKKNKLTPNTKSGHHGDAIDMSKKEHIVFVERDTAQPTANQMADNEYGDVLKLDSTNAIRWADTMTNIDEEQSNECFEQPKPTGTEIRFKDLELYENTSTLHSGIIVLTVECGKCKTKTDIKVDKMRSAAVRCEKCTNVIRVGFRAAMIHHYSTPTLGYLDLQGCQPFDLVMADSSLTVGCLGCSQETQIKGPQYGSNQVWCSKCHQKLQFKAESTRFFQLMPTSTVLENDDIPLPKRKTKTPGLREGFPLPENGTCKHYKKSFRWLRFPCCGKCYPCDACHDEQESHEMKYATRMVCGFCSKEQPYSQGTCTACHSSFTKAKTSHWEGGKGCRNKTVMSRGDDRKYKNTAKTTSRKAQAKANSGKSK